MVFKKENINNKKGFTLIELLVVIIIIGILSSVVIFNYGRFTSATLITNMAYEIATEIRKAQAFGLAVRDTVGSSSFDTDISHGVFFELTNLTGTTKNFNLFSDLNANNLCDGGSGSCSCDKSAGDECTNQFILQQDISISDLQVMSATDTCESVNDLSVSFKRPNPESLIKVSTGGSYHTAQITVSGGRAEDESTRYVIIRGTGQIAVESDPVCQ